MHRNMLQCWFATLDRRGFLWFQEHLSRSYSQFYPNQHCQNRCLNGGFLVVPAAFQNLVLRPSADAEADGTVVEIVAGPDAGCYNIQQRIS